MSLAIILSFAAVLVLLALALVWSSWAGWLKGLLVLTVTALYFFGYDAVHRIWGIPSTDALPERFVMLAAVVEEPGPKSKGAIYLWVSTPQEAGPLLEPRAYRLPYSKNLHKQVDDGIRKGRDGVAQMGTAEGKSGTGRGGGWLRPGNDEQEIKIRDLPVPQLPEK